MQSFFAGMAVDSAFSLGTDALYTPPGDGVAPLPCRIVIKGGDRFAGYEGGTVVQHVRFVDVRKSEVPQPREGGTFTLGPTVMTIDGSPRCEDPLRLVWTCSVP